MIRVRRFISKVLWKLSNWISPDVIKDIDGSTLTVSSLSGLKTGDRIIIHKA